MEAIQLDRKPTASFLRRMPVVQKRSFVLTLLRAFCHNKEDARVSDTIFA